MRRLGREAAGFLVVGAINFVLTFIVFTGLLKGLGVHHLAALVAAWSVGMVFSYAANFSWVFKRGERLHFRGGFARFVVANTVSLALNLLALHLIVQATGRDPFWVQVALIPCIVVFNFGTAKLWSLR